MRLRTLLHIGLYHWLSFIQLKDRLHEFSCVASARVCEEEVLLRTACLLALKNYTTAELWQQRVRIVWVCAIRVPEPSRYIWLLYSTFGCRQQSYQLGAVRAIYWRLRIQLSEQNGTLLVIRNNIMEHSFARLLWTWLTYSPIEVYTSRISAGSMFPLRWYFCFEQS